MRLPVFLMIASHRSPIFGSFALVVPSYEHLQVSLVLHGIFKPCKSVVFSEDAICTYNPV